MQFGEFFGASNSFFFRSRVADQFRKWLYPSRLLELRYFKLLKNCGVLKTVTGYCHRIKHAPDLDDRLFQMAVWRSAGPTQRARCWLAVVWFPLILCQHHPSSIMGPHTLTDRQASPHTQPTKPTYPPAHQPTRQAAPTPNHPTNKQMLLAHSTRPPSKALPAHHTPPRTMHVPANAACPSMTTAPSSRHAGRMGVSAPFMNRRSRPSYSVTGPAR